MKQDKAISASELRRRAEILLREKQQHQQGDKGGEETATDPQRVVHELQVRQIELELQNEELHHSRQEMATGLQWYTDLYEFAPVGYLTLDRVGAIHQVNLTGATLLGVERTRLVGGRFGSLVSEAERQRFTSFLEDVFASRAQQSCTLSLPQDKGMVWIQLTAIAAEGGACRVVMQDITEPHALEEQLRQAVQEKEASNQLLQTMIDGMEDTVVLVDASYQVLQMNRAARTLLGAGDARHLAQGGTIACHQLSHKRSEPCGGSDHPCPLALVMKSGETKKVLHTHSRADGERFPVELVVTPIRGADNEVVGIIEVGRDITERARLYEVKKKLMEQEFLQQKEKTITTLAGGIAHDFNNLLMGIMGNAELLQARDTDDRDRQKLTASIIHAGKKMAHLTRQLQAFAQNDLCHLEQVDINTMLREALTQVAISNTITLELRFGEELWPVMIDRGQLGQLVRNLVQNAVESMEGAGGTLTLTSANEKLSENWVCALGQVHPPGEFVRVMVADTGPGIPEDIRPRIFDPFFSTKFVGRGLGLAAVRGIVQRHGGGVCLKTSGRGTTISVRLPRAEPIPVPVHQKQDGQAVTLNQGQGFEEKVVLVVDDDRPILQLAKAILVGAGYRVVTAENGLEAEAYWSRNLGKICFAILDIQLPDINGKILYKRLKLLNPSLPVIMNSGYDHETAMEGMPLQPGDIFLQKPYGFMELVQLVKAAVGNSGKGGKAE